MFFKFLGSVRYKRANFIMMAYYIFNTTYMYNYISIIDNSKFFIH